MIPGAGKITENGLMLQAAARIQQLEEQINKVSTELERQSSVGGTLGDELESSLTSVVEPIPVGHPEQDGHEKLQSVLPQPTKARRTRLLDLARQYMTELVEELAMKRKEAADHGRISNSAIGRFTYGVASSLGKRASMEDFSEARIDDVDGEKVGMFGVYDGHGGVRAAEYVKQHLFINLIKHPKFITDTKAAIAEIYNHTDSEFLQADSSQTRDAGSTASTAIVVGDRLLVANVGDSRAVICKGGQAIAVSRDHKPDQSDERQRIEDAGGFVMWAGTWCVGGVPAVSRAFGDKLLKQYVVADPEIKEEVVDSSLEFLILASDGLWDVFTNEETVAMVKPIQDPQEAAEKLLQEASKRGSSDNIKVVIVRFLDGVTPGDKSEVKEKETDNDQNS